MNDQQEWFAKTFAILTGNPPFPWQSAMFQKMTAGEIPTSCSIPTGLGKTSIIAIWLLALEKRPDAMPRRLVYVVNRRTVVDQTTDEVEKIRRRLGDLHSELSNLFKDAAEIPLAVSTLRGQFADNREWSANPARPAVICGTVDMIGSRLLFSGYGAGFKLRPLHAGFLGQDALLVHDEAHLEPAFQELLVAVRQEQERSREFGRFHVMELSATTRDTGEPSARDAFTLTDEDREHSIVRKRIGAAKALRLIPCEDGQAPEKLVELALQHKDSKCAVLVFARTVDAVEKIEAKLPRMSVAILTGTMRGKEREDLIEKPVFKRFLPDAQPGDETVYLVSTSAGEVGVNISADHLVCDLSTFESMAQRFGRVNRFGLRDDTRIDIVHPETFKDDDMERRREKTLALLRELKADGSPLALSALPAAEREAAFAPKPVILPTSDILFDAWSLTTIRDTLPGRPPVEPWLHGISDWQPPETRVAWREEVEIITGDLPRGNALRGTRVDGREEVELVKGGLLDIYKPEDLLEDYPLKPHELLKDRSDRVFKHLQAIAARSPEQNAWLIDDDGNVEVLALAKLADKDRKDQIENKTVLLPPSAGGLDERGLLKGTSPTADDVADEWRDDKGVQHRIRLWDTPQTPAGMRRVRKIDTCIDPERAEEDAVADPGDGEKHRVWHWFERLKTGDSDGSRSSDKPVLLTVHTEDVVGHVTRIAAALGISDDLQRALKLAARLHDAGKARELWQRSIGNHGQYPPLAKSGGTMQPLELHGYRHEFGSLKEAQAAAEVEALGAEMKDLVLHLIAAHHGFARPHFPAENASDPDAREADAASVAAEVPRRFARLQRRYGRWGLAYLESLLRAADWAASAKPSKHEEDAR